MLQNGTCTKLYEVHCSDACGGRKTNDLKFQAATVMLMSLTIVMTKVIALADKKVQRQ